MTRAELGYEKRHADVLDSTMAYIEVGEGDPIVFLHGNPTSSYLWRNVIPYLEDQGRCIAPDLIGMGDSGRLEPSGPERYSFVEQRTYLEALLENIGVDQNVTLVLHDWGTALGLDWANRHRDAVKAIAYMEGIVMPLSMADFPPEVEIFRQMRSDKGEEIVIEHNGFIEGILPSVILRKLSEAEMDGYRAPFVDGGESRRAMVSWPRQIPFDGEPASVVKIHKEFAEWVSNSIVPKLFINAEPGGIIIGPYRDFCRTWPNQKEVTVRGAHFIQEDCPDVIGMEIADWHSRLRFKT